MQKIDLDLDSLRFFYCRLEKVRARAKSGSGLCRDRIEHAQQGSFRRYLLKDKPEVNSLSLAIGSDSQIVYGTCNNSGNQPFYAVEH